MVYNQTVLTCSGGVATSEGTWQIKNEGYSRGLAVFVAAQGCTCCVCAVCGPGITPRLGLSSRPAMYLHRRAENEISEDYETHFVRLLFIRDVKRQGENTVELLLINNV